MCWQLHQNQNLSPASSWSQGRHQITKSLGLLGHINYKLATFPSCAIAMTVDNSWGFLLAQNKMWMVVILIRRECLDIRKFRLSQGCIPLIYFISSPHIFYLLFSHIWGGKTLAQSFPAAKPCVILCRKRDPNNPQSGWFCTSLPSWQGWSVMCTN